MDFREERLGKLLEDLNVMRYCNTVLLENFDVDKKWEDGVHSVLRHKIILPACFEGKYVEFCLSTGREGEWDAVNPQFQLFVNQKRIQGMDVNHRTAVLTENGRKEEVFDLELRSYTKYQNRPILLRGEIREVDKEVEELYYDLRVAYQVACLLEKDEENYRKLIAALESACGHLDLRKPHSSDFHKGIKAAKACIMEELYHSCNGGVSPVVHCVGHTHIDIAWLWTLDVTRDKAVRSFSTVLELMDRYPEYIFMSSQPQLYQYVKEDAPDVYEKICQRVAEGRWEVEGGMFVEPDCNIPNGESLVRQCLYGIRFFQKEFGKKNHILWLPDVFGYSASLPQIMRKCGLDYFMTTKISWNETNQIPYDTFYWEGIDGTKVLTHFICARDYSSPTRSVRTNNEHYSAFTTNYNGYVTPAQIKGAWQRYQQKELNSQILLSYGYGDGGGGPTQEMLETQRRLALGIPGCPRTRQSSAIEFFRELEQEVKGKKRVPQWYGELYLEYHRGVYTSMGRNKRSNRKSEFLLCRSELWSVMANTLLSIPNDRETLLECWEILMRNQFHDILPGSSVAEVYEDSRREYEILSDKLLALEEKLLQTMTDQIAGDRGIVAVFNPNSFQNTDILEIPEPVSRKVSSFKTGGTVSVIQENSDGSRIFLAADVPAKGYCVFEPVDEEMAEDKKSSQVLKQDITEQNAAQANLFTEFALVNGEVETKWYHLCFNDKGQFTSIYDKEEGRELLQIGHRANVLMAYEDKPHDFDGWNIYDYYQERSWEVDHLIRMEVSEKGPLRYAIELEWKYQDSVIEQTIYLYSHTKRIDMKTRVDWKESQTLLKALFPVEIHSKEGTFEIQYGNIKRDLVKNTSWDQARFEVCYQKWMDISEDGYGIGFLNDCKYGVHVQDGTVGFTLIKSGIYPNPQADQEEHLFTYSLYPHQDGWRQGNVPRQAYQLNQPMTANVKNLEGGNLAKEYSTVSVSAENVIVEVVKPAQDSDDVVVRMYECYNRRTKVTVELPQEIREIYRCNLLEEEERLEAVNEKSFQIEIAPYEILTFKVKR